MSESAITFRTIGVIHSEHVAAKETPIQPIYAKVCKGRAEETACRRGREGYKSGAVS
jgi:hypothetical protein